MVAINEKRHSRAPWKAERCDLDGDDPTRWAVLADSQPNYFIATIENGCPGDSLYTEEANARLMAAAPDLLAACKALFDAPHQEHFAARLNDAEMAALEMMRAAIAKATDFDVTPLPD